MSTSKYLKKLSLDQLIFAKEEAEKLIKAITDQKKVKLWIVTGTVNEACYKEEDFQLAKKKVCELIMSEEFGADSVTYDHPKITKNHVYESEVDDWMKLNK